MSQDNSGDDAGQDRYGKTVADVPDGSAVRQKEEKGKRRRLSSGFFRFIIVRFFVDHPDNIHPGDVGVLRDESDRRPDFGGIGR